MTETLFWQPGRPPSPPSRSPGAPALLEGQLTLDLAVGGAQNGSRRPMAGPVPRDSGGAGAQTFSKPARRHRSRRVAEAPLADFSAAQGLSGPRRAKGTDSHIIGLDKPARADSPPSCRCSRPLPQRDEIETRCHKCGRRS